MKRREFLAVVGGATAWPFAARAQQPSKFYRIAIVHPADPVSAINENGPPKYRALFEEMRRLGYVEGRNLVIQRYSGEGRSDLSSELAREVVNTRPELILAFSRRLVQHFQRGTATIPIVAGTTVDPVGYGIAQSLARPGGNITGFSTDTGQEVLTKHIQLLKEVVPKAAKLAWLAPKEAWEARTGDHMRGAAARLEVALVGPPVGNPIREPEYRRVFSEMERERPDGLVVGSINDNRTHARLIVELVQQLRLPTIYPDRDFVDVGGLMAYAIDYVGLHRRIPGYIDRILKGEKPAELPFYQPTECQLIINLKAAAGLSLAIPPVLLAPADEVIE